MATVVGRISPTRAIRLGESWYGEGAVPPTEYLFYKVVASVLGTAPSL